MIRRNVDLKILLFDNRIYGLTKGQVSPTSELGKKTKSTPFGSIDRPFNPLAIALGANATFVARTVATDTAHMLATLPARVDSQGAAFVRSPGLPAAFNDEVPSITIAAKTSATTSHHQARGPKPMVFGKAKDKAIRVDPKGFSLEVGPGGEGAAGAATRPCRPTLAMALANLETPMPFAMGVLRAVKAPSSNELAWQQEQSRPRRRGRQTRALLGTATPVDRLERDVRHPVEDGAAPTKWRLAPCGMGQRMKGRSMLPNGVLLVSCQLAGRDTWPLVKP